MKQYQLTQCERAARARSFQSGNGIDPYYAACILLAPYAFIRSAYDAMKKCSHDVTSFGKCYSDLLAIARLLRLTEYIEVSSKANVFFSFHFVR